MRSVARLRKAWGLGGLLLSLLLGPLSPSSVPAQDLAAVLRTHKAAVPHPEQRMAAALRAAVSRGPRQGAPGAQAALPGMLRWLQEDVVEVYLYLYTLTPTELQALQQQGVTIYRHHPRFRLVYGALPAAALEAVAALPFVRWIGPPVYGIQRTGSVTSKGDIVMRAAEVRRSLGVRGRGVRVGIISDSLTDLPASVRGGNLPADVLILADGSEDPEALDEGRALAEIVHDLAPGATLMFHSGLPTSLDMIAAIEALTAAGADIIIDDIGFLDEPVFEDGAVAQAVQSAIDSGVVYVTAAGNEAERHYRGVYREFDPNDRQPDTNLHDFGGGDTTMAIRLAPQGVLVAVLHWPNPFDGSRNTADYDLYLFDNRGSIEACKLPGLSGVCASTDAQLSGTAPPMEVVQLTNTTRVAVTVGLTINRFAGESLPLVVNLFGDITVLEHNVARGSTFGHACVREVLAVGAIDVNDPGFNEVERFSSRGPCELAFPQPETRTKPDLMAADGVMTSLAAFRPFFGTSAAVPHVAAVAALLFEVAGGPGALSNLQLANILRLAAIDLGAVGNDNTSGHGSMNAVLAVQLLQTDDNTPPQSTIDAPAGDVVVVPGTGVRFQGACLDTGEGPFTSGWDFSGAAPPSNLQSPGVIPFPAPGRFPITFTCTDAAGVPDPTPATRMVTVNQPPQSRIDSPTPPLSLTAGDRVAFDGACSDTENHVPFTFLWYFGGGGSLASSTQQKPAEVQFNTPGSFIVSFTCIDALGTPDPTPAMLQVIVRSASEGGGCSILPGDQSPSPSPLAAMGNVLLPLLVLLVLRAWCRYRPARRGGRAWRQ